MSYDLSVPDYIRKQALESPPAWEKDEWRNQSKHVHEWQTYVGPRVRALWSGMTDVMKIAIAGDADDHADNEIWE